jgi:dTDP-4-dehydrorhamnose 3,5-epimerase
MLKIQTTDLADVLVISTRWFTDDRGSFTETYNRQRWVDAGITTEFVQDNHVVSTKAGTLRGMHYQTQPAAQAKLVRAVKGAIWDAVVDLRHGSPSFGQWFGLELSAENRLQLLVPVGFAHGYVTLTDDAEVLYKVDNFYSPSHEGGMVWNDPAVGIQWPLPASRLVIAPRDAALPTLAELPPLFTWESPR